MSYDLRIWEQPASSPRPATLEEAGRMMLELEKIETGTRAKFVALAEKMVEHHTYSAQYKHDDPRSAEATWLGDPVATAKDMRQGVWAIELPDADRVQCSTSW